MSKKEGFPVEDMMKRFADVFGAPPGFEDVLELLSRPEERALLLAMANETDFPVKDVAKALNYKEDQAEALMKECYHRGLLNLTEEGRSVKGSLYSSLDLFAQFKQEQWAALPQEKREALDAWYLEEYGKRCMPGIVAKTQGRIMTSYDLPEPPSCFLGNDVVLPLEEALKFIDDVQSKIYLVPCNCRSIAMRCKNPVDTCLLYPPRGN